ncbi:MAG: 4Fe-4S binding protein [bacterium]
MKRLKSVEAILRWKWYPDIVRIPVFIGSFYLLYVLLFGEQAEGGNAGLSVMWVVMWSMLPVTFVLLGRFWCGICPFSKAGDLVQKMVGNEIHPPLFLKKYGVWFAYAFFIVILAIEALVHMPGSTAASSILLLAIFTMAMVSGALFKRRTWCRYLCPLGVGGGVFSRLRIIKMTKDNKLCSECKEFECLQGSEKYNGCPMGLCVKKHDMDADCISCGNCLKSCPNDSPRIELRSPVEGFLSNIRLSQAESAFASSFIGFSIALYLIKDYIGKMNRVVGFENIIWNELLVIIVFTGLSFSLFYIFSHIMRPVTRQSQKYNFRFFGFFLIPYIFFALVNLTSIHGVAFYGMTLYHNLKVAMGFPLHEGMVHHTPLLSAQVKHIIQGTGIITGSLISIIFCMVELQKALNTSQRNKIIAVFSIMLVAITGYILYLFLFF